MSNVFDEIKSYLTGALASLVSLIVGHRLGIQSERRKEYNEIADEFYAVVNRELTAGAAHTFQLDDKIVHALRRRMASRQQRRFDSALQAYKIAAQQTEQDSAGQVLFVDVKSVNNALRELAKVVHRK